MAKYITVQNDCWDSISLKIYNDENFMHRLLEANPGYNAIVVFPANIELDVPEVETRSTIDFPAWRRRSGR